MPSHDDPAISDAARLWRRIHPNWLTKNADGSFRPQSVAFRDRRSGHVSVHIAELANLDEIISRFPDMSIAEITVGAAHDAGAIRVAGHEGAKEWIGRFDIQAEKGSVSQQSESRVDGFRIESEDGKDIAQSGRFDS